MTPEQLQIIARIIGHAFHHERDMRRDAAFIEQDLARQYRDLQASEIMHSLGMVMLRVADQIRDL